MDTQQSLLEEARRRGELAGQCQSRGDADGCVEVREHFRKWMRMIKAPDLFLDELNSEFATGFRRAQNIKLWRGYNQPPAG